MTFEIAIAISTAVVSLLISIVGLIGSVISNRYSSRSAEEIETLKHDLKSKEIQHKLRDEYLAKTLRALDAFVQAIQRMKDIIQKVLNAPGSSLDCRTALDQVVEARDIIFSCYETELPNLAKEEAKFAHNAKNRALAINAKLQESLKGLGYVSDIGTEQRQLLSQDRNYLTDLQNQLRDSRSRRLVERIESN